MAYPSGQQPNIGFGTAPNIVINYKPSQTVIQSPVMVNPQESRASRSFMGRLVESITQSTRYQKAAAFTGKVTRPLREWAIDFGGALKILGKETWKGVSYGALSGLAAGGVVTFLCPPLIGPAFTASITAGITAGGIIGYLCGAAKASDYYDQARQARRAEAELVNQQQQQEREIIEQQFESQAV